MKSEYKIVEGRKDNCFCNIFSGTFKQEDLAEKQKH